MFLQDSRKSEAKKRRPPNLVPTQRNRQEQFTISKDR